MVAQRRRRASGRHAGSRPGRRACADRDAETAFVILTRSVERIRGNRLAVQVQHGEADLVLERAGVVLAAGRRRFGHALAVEISRWTGRCAIRRAPCRTTRA
jgi:hypothetical protein